MIPDTSRQDTALTAPGGRRWKRLGVIAVSVVLGLGAAGWAISSWREAGDASASAASVRIATVERGRFVRDAAVAGRVVAAVSPTLYAAAPGTVALRVNAGDTVRRGDVLAVIDSPEIATALRREQSAFDELQAEISRQRILAQKARLTAQRDADQAEIERAAAQRQLERVEHAGVEGVLAKNDFDKAKDTLRSAEIRGKHASAAAVLEGDDVRLQLKTRESQLERQKLTLDDAKRKVEELTLRAPLEAAGRHCRFRRARPRRRGLGDFQLA